MSVYAQEYGYFFNSSNKDRTYNADSFEVWLKPFFVSGVFAGGLQVTAQSDPDMTVSVSAGYANLNGKPAYWSSDNTLALATASGVYSRIDTIVLRRDNTNRTISIEVVTGTASANPQPTAPTRTSDIYELVLAQIAVGVGATEVTATDITDTRTDSTICGYVASTVDEIDFEYLTLQFESWVADYKAETESDYDDYLSTLSAYLAEYRSTIDADETTAAADLTSFETTIRNYIAQLEAIIDSQSVASLQYQVDGIETDVSELQAIAATHDANTAEEYDATEVYAEGDYCLYEHVLYKRNAWGSGETAAAEVWTAGHWTAVNIGGELTSHNEAIAKLQSEAGPFMFRMDANNGHLYMDYDGTYDADKWSVSSAGHLIYTF